MIHIIDYGMGNTGSVYNILKRIGVSSEITSEPEKIERAEKLILPGVGAFDNAQQKILETGLKEVLDKKVLIEKIPLLGICLGMQLLTERSEEGVKPGLGWIKGRTLAFKNRIPSDLKIPHMGWNLIRPVRKNPLTAELPFEPRFYFVHSFFVQVTDEKNVLATTHYGFDFHSIIQQDNIWGVQFHPEKSHKYGMKLLENFAKL